MICLPKPWKILSEAECDYVWDKVHAEFQFRPGNDSQIRPFVFKTPVDAYDISDSPLWRDDDVANEIIRAGFAGCMQNDDYMYALDWQHTGFRYNPLITDALDYPVFVEDNRYAGGGYNVYFPPFYPDGDYHFFIGRDFTWGYLTHPWLKQAFIFGRQLMAYFSASAEKLGFRKLPEN